MRYNKKAPKKKGKHKQTIMIQVSLNIVKKKRMCKMQCMYTLSRKKQNITLGIFSRR